MRPLSASQNRFARDPTGRFGPFRNPSWLNLNCFELLAFFLLSLSAAICLLLVWFSTQPTKSAKNPNTMAASVVATPPSIAPLFVSHGSPTLPFDDIPARAFLLELGKRIVPAPKAILAVSAHWTTSEPTVSLTTAPETIHDFYGFPAPLYKQQYPAPGAPELAKRTAALIKAAGLPVREDPKRGLDHGAWNPLKLMYPEARIPVVQLSVQPNKDAAFHYKMGRALAPLKSEGVLVLGSGGVVHNLREVFSGSRGSSNWAKDFASWLDTSLVEKRFEDVCSYQEKGPNAHRAHPSPEHFLPLHVALGAAGEDAKAKRLHDSWEYDVLSMATYEFIPKENQV